MFVDENKGLKIYDFHVKTNTAGPSPHNNIRAELFLLGCNKAQSGNPCEGCFNYSLWNKDKAEHAIDTKIIAEKITEACGDNKYITIGGGEPTDQIFYLTDICKRLKKNGFHIMVYTWRTYEDMLYSKKCNKLFKYIDMLVDGPYDKSQRLYNESACDGLLSSIGSGNQGIVNIKSKIKYKMKDVKELTLTTENDLIFELIGGNK